MVATLSLMALPAAAHSPVFVTADDRLPIQGPLLEDGRISYAVYGTLEQAGATRGFRTYLGQGDLLVADLLIPAREPEESLPADRLPTVTIRNPDGTARNLASDMRVRFDEPFSQTSYWRIAELREPAPQTGVYEMTVTARAPERFTLATGVVEGAPGTVTGAEPVPEGGLTGWYTTPPAAPPVETPVPASPEPDSFPWMWVAVALPAVAIIVVLVALGARRRSRPAD